MMRKCHLNTCPVGVATQDPVLRARFTGQPEHVINYFFFVAEELREIMAAPGLPHRRGDDRPGRPARHARPAVEHWKAKALDLTRLLYAAPAGAGTGLWNSERQDHGLDKALDHELIAGRRPALDGGEPVRDRAADPQRQPRGGRHAVRRGGARATATPACRTAPITRAPHRHRPARASAPSSPAASTLELTGDANDYVGKGLSGGRIVVRSPPEASREPTANIIVGNTVLYGAIAGEAYFEGVAGERFAVRNSGAVAVVEGVGDHGCEYMTGGVVVVLGETGRNFAAGMSGGIAYVYDPAGRLRRTGATWPWSNWRPASSRPPAGETRPPVLAAPSV